MNVRFLCAFQISNGKVFDVGRHVDVYNTWTKMKEPAKFLAGKVCEGDAISGSRWKEPVYMFLSVDGALKSYMFNKQLGPTYGALCVQGLKEIEISDDTPKVNGCLQNMHDLITNSLAQVKTTTQLLGATAGTLLIQEKAHAKLVLSTSEDQGDSLPAQAV